MLSAVAAGPLHSLAPPLPLASSGLLACACVRRHADSNRRTLSAGQWTPALGMASEFGSRVTALSRRYDRIDIFEGFMAAFFPVSTCRLRSPIAVRQLPDRKSTRLNSSHL